MKIKKYIMLFLLLEINFLYAFEVNTHQALTRCAITSECNNNGGTANLDTFVQNSNLSDYKKYNEEIFEQYNKKYSDYIAKEEEAIYTYKVTTTGDYKGMIEAGSILEDAVHHNAVASFDGRFNNHFYAAQLNSKENCRKERFTAAGVAALTGRPIEVAIGGTVILGDTALMKTNKALCTGFGVRTDSIDWVLNKNVNLSIDMEFNKKHYELTNRRNEYGLDDAFEYFHDSFKGSEDNRRKNQAKLFVSLGFMVHLLQDIHSPSHCRDSSHPKGDYLEMYGREDGGFFLRNGSFNHGKNNPHIVQAIKTMDMHKEMLKNNSFVSYEDFFKKEAEWVSKNFFAEAHMPILPGVNSSFGGGTTINNLTDIDSIFDDNALPSKGTTYENEKDEIVSTGNTVGHVHGDLVTYDGLGEKPIALIDRGLFFDNEHMILPTYKMDYRKNKLVPGKANTRALEMTSVNVMPRAIASTQAFINFFFRGQMKTNLSADRRTLIVQNVSDEKLVNSSKLVTFKKGGGFRLYYRNGRENVPINYIPYSLNQDLVVNREVKIDIGDVINRLNLPQGTKITVVYDGDIGDDMGGYDEYNIGMRGMSADVFEVQEKPEECTDTSLKASIELVKSRLQNRSNCVGFPDIEFEKIIWINDDARCQLPITYKNAQLMGRGSYRDEAINANELINYFNDKIYKLPPRDNSPRTANIQPIYEVGRYNRQGHFYIDYVVKVYKGGNLEQSFTLDNFLEFKYFNGASHVGEKHYDVWCHGDNKICTYLKARVATDSTDGRDSEFGLDWVANYNAYQYMIGRITQQMQYYYENSSSNEEYPRDWLKRIVDWIEGYDCTKNQKSNVFYDEQRIEKSSELKGL